MKLTVTDNTIVMLVSEAQLVLNVSYLPSVASVSILSIAASARLLYTPKWARTCSYMNQLVLPLVIIATARNDLYHIGIDIPSP